MPTVNLSLFAGAGAQFFDNNGDPLSGGLIYTYQAGTTTPLATYTNSGGTVAHANPIVLDSAGRVPTGEIWTVAGSIYKFVLKTSADVTVGTYDNISGLNDYTALLATLAGSGGSALIGTVQKMGGVTRTVQAKLNDFFNVMDFGAYGDGKHDDTAAIQAAIDAAGSILTNGQPPSIYMNGGQNGYAAPVVFLPPGAYRLTNSLRLYTGMTMMGQNDIAYTVESTRLIMDTATNAAIATGSEPGGVVNKDKPILILQKTYTPTGTVLQPNNCTTVANIGFWIVNPNGTIAQRGGIGWSIDPATGLGNSGTGSAIYCNENLIDTRIKRCNFYSIPNAAIWVDGSASASKIEGSFQVHECEFDTPIVDIRIENSRLGLVVSDSLFFSGSYAIYADDVEGIFQSTGCQYTYNTRLKFFPANFDVFEFVGNFHEGSGGNGTAFDLNSAKQVNIVGNHFGLSVESTINLIDVQGGVVANNTIVDSGYNASPVAPPLSHAAIRLSGCSNVVVEGNSIITPGTSGGAVYNNFGIFTVDPSACVISNNYVSGAYNGAGYRDQPRRINVGASDIVNDNYTGSPTTTTPEWRIHDGFGGQLSLYRQSQISTSTTSDTPLSKYAQARITFHFAQVSTTDNAMYEVLIGRQNTTGAYVILNVSQNGNPGAGNGPHTVGAGNTIAFSISGTNLRVTYVLTTDPILTSIQLSAAKHVNA